MATPYYVPDSDAMAAMPGYQYLANNGSEPSSDASQSSTQTSQTVQSAQPENPGILSKILSGIGSFAEPAIATGAAVGKGIGQFGEDVVKSPRFQEFAAIMGAPYGIPYDDSQKSIFDYSHPQNAVTRFLGGLEQNNPNASYAGNVIGRIVAPLAIPGLGEIGEGVAGATVGSRLGAGILGRAANSAVNAGTQGALLSQVGNQADGSLGSAGEDALNAAIANLLFRGALGAGKLAVNTAQRFKNVGTAPLDEIKGISDGLYNEAIHQPTAEGARIEPEQTVPKLQGYIDNFESGNPNRINNEYLPLLKQHLQELQNPENNAGSPADAHEVIKQINNEATSAMPGNKNQYPSRPQNRQAAAMLYDLADTYKGDLRNGLVNEGYPDSAHLLDVADNYYKNTLLPIRDNPVGSKVDFFKQNAATLAKAPISNPHHTLINLLGSMGNIFNRFGSTYESPYANPNIANGFKNMLQNSQAPDLARLSAILSQPSTFYNPQGNQ